LTFEGEFSSKRLQRNIDEEKLVLLFKTLSIV